MRQSLAAPVYGLQPVFMQAQNSESDKATKSAISFSSSFCFRFAVPHSRNCSADDCLQIQACHAAIGVETSPVFLKQRAFDVAMAINHLQAASDSKIIAIENVRTLHTKQ